MNDIIIEEITSQFSISACSLDRGQSLVILVVRRGYSNRSKLNMALGMYAFRTFKTQEQKTTLDNIHYLNMSESGPKIHIHSILFCSSNFKMLCIDFILFSNYYVFRMSHIEIYPMTEKQEN